MEVFRKISIIIPAHNEQDYILSTIESINDSIGNPEYEIIVVCNACSDNTVEIARNAGVTVIETPVAGAAEACNLGASHANGDHLMFLDADTSIRPNLLMEVHKALSDRFIGGRTVVRWDSQKIASRICSLVSYIHKYKWG